MSGGSLDYAYLKVEQIASDVARNATTPLHKAFAKHLVKIAEALKAMEWMLSCDTSPGDERDAIEKVISVNEELESVIEEAKKAKEDLEEVLTRTMVV